VNLQARRLDRPTVIGRALLLVAAAGVLVGIAGTIVAWRLAGRLQSGVDQSLSVAEESLVTTDQSIAVIAQVLSDVDGLLGTLETSVADTAQTVFYTYDTTFIDDDDEDSTLEEDLCEVIRDTPRRGEIWTVEDWEAEGDFRAVACGITAGGQTFSVSGMVVDALESFAAVSSPSPEYRSLLTQATSALRAYDGAGLAAWKPAKPKAPKVAKKSAGNTETK